MLANARVVTPRRVLDRGWVSIEGTRLVGVGAGDPPRVDGAVHDLGGRYVLPGFVDLHMHGGGGAQITTDDHDEILAAVAFHRRHGTTRTLASLVTDQLDRMAASVRAITDLIEGGDESIVGVHLEGPFLNPAKRGSHHSEYLLAPDVTALRHLLDAGAGSVRVVTLAPELPGGMDLVRETVAAGAIASVGHTDATFEEAGRRSRPARGWRRTSSTRCARSTTANRDRRAPRSPTTR